MKQPQFPRIQIKDKTKDQGKGKGKGTDFMGRRTIPNALYMWRGQANDPTAPACEAAKTTGGLRSSTPCTGSESVPSRLSPGREQGFMRIESGPNGLYMGRWQYLDYYRAWEKVEVWHLHHQPNNPAWQEEWWIPHQEQEAMLPLPRVWSWVQDCVRTPSVPLLWRPPFCRLKGQWDTRPLEQHCYCNLCIEKGHSRCFC